MAAILSSILGGGGLKGAADLVNAIKGKSPEDAAKLAQINADITELQMKYKGEFDAHQAAMELLREQGEQQSRHDQVEVNKVEASANGDGTFWGNAMAFWKSGWRPACGWVCALGFFVSFVVGPCWSFWKLSHGGKVSFPELNSQMLTTLLFGMLGLAGARSFDKKNGTSS
jgi:hypothetical protein